ncbi:MAG TPA: type VI secretion system baseplate subunit TssE, partial [Pseudomonas sp.]|nr:type VI secretion system baseplate subunit TssE [Pseudomonas sp.]
MPNGMRPLLFERLSDSAAQAPALDRQALADSVREELT